MESISLHSSRGEERQGGIDEFPSSEVDREVRTIQGNYDKSSRNVPQLSPR